MRRITALVKPVSGACGLDCAYCFYRELDPHGSRMSAETVAALIRLIPEDTAVDFAFQGGEPLLAGVGYYRDFCEAVTSAKLRARYSLQTNGTGINEEYCELFKEYGFLIGLSLDGTKAAHDAVRIYKNGKGTYDAVISAAEMLGKYGVPFDVLTVITNKNENDAAKIYEDYKKRGFRFVQLIPCLPLHNGDHGLCPTKDGLARFFCEFFDLWYDDVRAGKASFDVREFSELSDALNGRPSGCRYHGACVPQLVIESDGGMYPCDFFVRPEYRLGSVYDTSLESSLESSGMAAFIADGPQGLESCRTCPYLSVCRGMCRRMRDLLRPGTCPWAKIIDHITTQ